VSRSSSIVVAYLMKKYQMKLESALTLTYSRRRVIRPNEGFLEQLVEYEKVIGVDEKTMVKKCGKKRILFTFFFFF
jgi:protein-tyrosine phosphatase